MSADNERRRLAERARKAGLAVAAERERRATEAERPLAPGDLVLDRSTAELPVEWAVIDVEPGDAQGGGRAEEPAGAEAEKGETAGAQAAATPRRLLLVPADSMPLRGPADVAVDASDADPADHEAAAPTLGPLILRCAFGVWVDSARLDPSLRGGRLPEAAVREARERYRAEAAGRPSGTPLEREAAADPEYRHWVESVLRQAREALLAGDEAPAAGSPGAISAPSSLEERRRRRPFALDRLWAIAASVLLLVGLGLAAGLLRQQQALTELRAAEDRLAQDLTSVRAERDALRGESARLDERLDRLAEEHRRELAERERAAQAAERGLLDRLAALQERLHEATTRVRINLPFEYLVPVEPERGSPETVELPADAQYLLLLLEYVGTETFDSYRLELYRKGEEGVVWATDGLVKSGPVEFVVELPAGLLPPGGYRLELLGVRDGDGAENVKEYEIEVVEEGGG